MLLVIVDNIARIPHNDEQFAVAITFLDLYSEGTWFESGPSYRLPLSTFFLFSAVSSDVCLKHSTTVSFQISTCSQFSLILLHEVTCILLSHFEGETLTEGF